jgi:hypothetical protein
MHGEGDPALKGLGWASVMMRCMRYAYSPMHGGGFGIGRFI